jgi:hypothetical protein
MIRKLHGPRQVMAGTVLLSFLVWSSKALLTAPLWLGAELVRSLANRARRHAHVGLSSTVAAASRRYKFRRLAKGHQS